MELVTYFLRRAGRALIVVVGLIVVTFFLTRAIAEPVNVILGPDASQEQRDRIEHQLGLDQSLPKQFVDYIGNAVQGDFGESISQGRPALGIIVDRLPASLLLAGVAIILATILGLILGILGGLRPGSWIDRITITTSAVSVAVPDFWLGLMFIIIFSVNLGWFPTGGYGGFTDLSYVILPAVTLALLPAGRLARVARESVAEEMGKQYVVAARARGLTTAQIARRHVLKNVAVPTSTVIGYDFLVLFAGYAASLEVVFGWPGVGRLAIEATLRQDVVLVSALVVVTGLIVGIGNIVLDMFHAAIDRRVSA
jgi:peptide/nickel transport system permease protein